MNPNKIMKISALLPYLKKKVLKLLSCNFFPLQQKLIRVSAQKLMIAFASLLYHDTWIFLVYCIYVFSMKASTALGAILKNYSAISQHSVQKTGLSTEVIKRLSKFIRSS